MFVLSKLFWLVSAPGNLFMLLILAGILRLALSGRRRGLGLIAFPAIVLLAIAYTSLGEWITTPLEERFPPLSAPPGQVDGIILLGGAVDTGISAAHGRPSLNRAAERITATASLARRYPDARIAVIGGSGQLLGHPGESEAELMRILLVDLGVDDRRLILEDRSRNTFENALYAKAVVRPGADETWLLVTSAAHMPRAVGCFRHVGWQVLAYPVNYRARYGLVPVHLVLGDNLVLFDEAVREWVGLVAYRLLGRIDKLFPGP